MWQVAQRQAGGAGRRGQVLPSALTQVSCLWFWLLRGIQNIQWKIWEIKNLQVLNHGPFWAVWQTLMLSYSARLKKLTTSLSSIPTSCMLSAPHHIWYLHGSHTVAFGYWIMCPGMAMRVFKWPLCCDPMPSHHFCAFLWLHGTVKTLYHFLSS